MPSFLHFVRYSQASPPLAVTFTLEYPALCNESKISLLRSGESSAITIGTSLLFLSPSKSISETLRPVSGLISVIIFSKSKIITSLPLTLIIPVAIPLSSPLSVLSGLIISAHDTLLMPHTVCTWNATSSVLKLVITIISVAGLADSGR